jgi:hypothetical protein
MGLTAVHLVSTSFLGYGVSYVNALRLALHFPPHLLGQIDNGPYQLFNKGMSLLSQSQQVLASVVLPERPVMQAVPEDHE